MKTKIFVLALVTLMGAVNVNAAILTVDNNVVVSGTPGIYSNLQSAIAAAFSGDTILIVGSPDAYSDITIAKRLVIIGPGFNPQRPNINTAYVPNITLNDGSSNSTFSGLKIYSITFNNTILVQNITLSKNHIVNLYGNNACSGLLIYNNVISAGLNIGTSTSSIISNNIFYSSGSIGTGKASTIIRNNLFYDVRTAFAWMENAEFSNNIFIKIPTFYENTAIDRMNIYAKNCTFNNNLTYLCAPSGNLPFGSNVGSDNIIEQDPVFLNVDGAFSYANNYGLHSSSPAKNAGTDGTDIGPSGGAYPLTNVFPITGHPAIPYISQMQINGPSSVPLGSSQINITVKAKKQN